MGGIMSSSGDDRVAGSQSLQFRISFNKSVQHTEMIEKRYGPGVPPNISHRHKRRIRTSLWINQVRDLAAAFSSTWALLQISCRRNCSRTFEVDHRRFGDRDRKKT
jgi:hypothetical protein